MDGGVLVAGVSMTEFTKPGRGEHYDIQGARAVKAALQDAGIGIELVQQAYAGYVYADSAAGQRVIYQIGRTGMPVVNVNNNCASGSSALFLAHQAVRCGAVDCALAVGFEQMLSGPLREQWPDRPSPLQVFTDVVQQKHGVHADVPLVAQFFGAAGIEYINRYGTDPATFAKVAVKARRHAANNPNAVFREQVSLEQVLASPHLFGPVTRLQACPPTCGAAAAILVSERFARAHGLDPHVRISAQVMVTDTDRSFDNAISAVGFDLSRAAADQVYEQAGVDPRDIAVVELHDCFTVNEVLTYEALRLCEDGGAEEFVESGDNTYGGRVVVNPSGGLLSKGHPLGATGLAQCAELVWQLRGHGQQRQVPNATVALQHNAGLGGAAVVTVYETLRR